MADLAVRKLLVSADIVDTSSSEGVTDRLKLAAPAATDRGLRPDTTSGHRDGSSVNKANCTNGYSIWNIGEDCRRQLKIEGERGRRKRRNYPSSRVVAKSCCFSWDRRRKAGKAAPRGKNCCCCCRCYCSEAPTEDSLETQKRVTASTATTR